MSLVGPRPTIMNQVIKYDDFQKRRLRVRPGMTGLAQVNGNTALTWGERIIYDVKYVDSYSFLLDIKILIKTILVVLFGEDNFKKVPTK
jgi:lipopolysaccharide/colanic/teichoic acid biosynthesis glycosyltransferase